MEEKNEFENKELLALKKVYALRSGECSIGLEEMTDPYMDANGFSYQKENILEWLEDHDTSPASNEKLADKNLIPNKTLKNVLTEYWQKIDQFIEEKKKLEANSEKQNQELCGLKEKFLQLNKEKSEFEKKYMEAEEILVEMRKVVQLLSDKCDDQQKQLEEYLKLIDQLSRNQPALPVKNKSPNVNGKSAFPIPQPLKEEEPIELDDGNLLIIAQNDPNEFKKLLTKNAKALELYLLHRDFYPLTLDFQTILNIYRQRDNYKISAAAKAKLSNLYLDIAVNMINKLDRQSEIMENLLPIALDESGFAIMMIKWLEENEFHPQTFEFIAHCVIVHSNTIRSILIEDNACNLTYLKDHLKEYGENNEIKGCIVDLLIDQQLVKLKYFCNDKIGSTKKTIEDLKAIPKKEITLFGSRLFDIRDEQEDIDFLELLQKAMHKIQNRTELKTLIQEISPEKYKPSDAVKKLIDTLFAEEKNINQEIKEIMELKPASDKVLR